MIEVPGATPAPPAGPPAPLLPVVRYALLVLALSLALGGFAQAAFLPIGIWWSQLFILFLPTVLLLRALGLRPLRFLRLDRLPRPGQYLPAIGVALLVFLSASALMSACEQLVPPVWVQRFDLTRVLGAFHGPWQAVLFASVVVGAPLSEETVFRGYLQPALRERVGRQRAIWIQALLFALVHLDPIGFLPRFLLGVAFGHLVELTGSLWSSIFAHALNNGISTALFLIYGPGPAGEAAPGDVRWALLLSFGAGIAVTALLAWLRSGVPVLPLAAEVDPEVRAALPTRARTFAEVWTWAAALAVGVAAFGLAAARLGTLAR